jgi:hypothetical protein
MAAVKPSVSLAAVLQGTAFTVLVEALSSPVLSDPRVVFGSNPVAGSGAAPLGAAGVSGGAPPGMASRCPYQTSQEYIRARSFDCATPSTGMHIQRSFWNR